MTTPTRLKLRQTGFRLPQGEWFNDIINRVNGLVAGTLQQVVAAFGLSLNNTVLAVVAFAGGGQGSATQLTGLYNSVDTVATAADSVKLPQPSAVGQMCVISNTTANACQVFGSGTATINAVATATGVSLPAGKTGIYIARSAGAAATWRAMIGA